MLYGVNSLLERITSGREFLHEVDGDVRKNIPSSHCVLECRDVECILPFIIADQQSSILVQLGQEFWILGKEYSAKTNGERKLLVIIKFHILNNLLIQTMLRRSDIRLWQVYVENDECIVAGRNKTAREGRHQHWICILLLFESNPHLVMNGIILFILSVA